MSMKVFLDTNIFLEYFERRRQYEYVSRLLSAIEDGRLKAVVSAGCIYTLAYLVRSELKRQGSTAPNRRCGCARRSASCCRWPPWQASATSAW